MIQAKSTSARRQPCQVANRFAARAAQRVPGSASQARAGPGRLTREEALPDHVFVDEASGEWPALVRGVHCRYSRYSRSTRKVGGMERSGEQSAHHAGCTAERRAQQSAHHAGRTIETTAHAGNSQGRRQARQALQAAARQRSAPVYQTRKLGCAAASSSSSSRSRMSSGDTLAYSRDSCKWGPSERMSHVRGLRGWAARQDVVGGAGHAWRCGWAGGITRLASTIPRLDHRVDCHMPTSFGKRAHLGAVVCILQHCLDHLRVSRTGGPWAVRLQCSSASSGCAAKAARCARQPCATQL